MQVVTEFTLKNIDNIINIIEDINTTYKELYNKNILLTLTLTSISTKKDRKAILTIYIAEKVKYIKKHLLYKYNANSINVKEVKDIIEKILLPNKLF